MAYPDILVRYHLADLLAAILIPGTLASVAPVNSSQERLILFFLALALEIPSMLWGASIARSFEINHPIKRFLVHVYAFVSFIGFLGTLFGMLLFFMALLGKGHWNYPWLEFLVAGAGPGLTLSMVLLEWKRGLKEQEAGAEKRP